ncbi:MAG: hypothetical protein AMJ81_09490 [Phycisphaerae bacterium SM23_33]|nr:MAG: hypothetical protein AMJ81_09490 [Phycisphaerae bacterium SM23_33]
MAEFARRAARRVGPAAPVAAWCDPQAKTVFYFGRNIPDVMWTRQRLVTRLGEQEGTARWEAWLKEGKHVLWIFTYARHAHFVEPLGFQIDTQVAGRDQKKLVFTLMRHRPAAGAPS